MLGVVGIGERADVPDDERAVGILERLVDGVEALRLEGEHLALALPAHEILRSLEQHHVGGELAVLELLLDPLVEHVAEAALDRHREAGKLALEFARQRLVVGHRAAGIDRQRLFRLGLGVELVQGFRLAETARQDESGKQSRQAVRRVTRSEHFDLARWVVAWILSKSAEAGATRLRPRAERSPGYSTSCIGVGTKRKPSPCLASWPSPGHGMWKTISGMRCAASMSNSLTRDSAPCLESVSNATSTLG